MAFFRYIGGLQYSDAIVEIDGRVVNERDGVDMPAVVQAFKKSFPLDEAVEVTDPHAVSKLRGNHYFEECEAPDGYVAPVGDKPRRGRRPKAE